jgi:hypothetical protein
MTFEHAPGELLRQYVTDSSIATEVVWSLEAHLESCQDCRLRLADVVAEHDRDTTALLDQVLVAVHDGADLIAPVRQRHRVRRWLYTFTSPAALSWVFALVLVAALALVIDHIENADGSLIPVFAPIMPVGAVALAWARGIDPAFEIVAATPRAGLYLVLRRTVAVLVVLFPALAVVGWLAGTEPALWLLPCLAFTVGTLALGGAVGVLRAAIVLSGCWAVVVIAPSVAVDHPSPLVATASLPIWTAVAVLGAAVVVARADVYRRLGSQE